jgi:hypothetical protein
LQQSLTEHLSKGNIMATATKKTAAAAKITAPKTTKKLEGAKAADTNKSILKPAASATKTTRKTPTVSAATTTNKLEKPPAVKKTRAKKADISVSPEHRYHMIATAAYYQAERRGFAGGYEMQDWISAEAEIDVQLKS